MALAAIMTILAAGTFGCGEGVQSVSGPGIPDQLTALAAPQKEMRSLKAADPILVANRNSRLYKGASSVTSLVSARAGGRLVCGRHILVFWPGALAQDTEITLVDATSQNGYVSAECYPEGLQFNAKVTLQSDFSDIADPAGYVMYWLVDAPDGVTCVNLGGEVSKNGKGIVATLAHFSVYAPGKAGW